MNTWSVIVDGFTAAWSADDFAAKVQAEAHRLGLQHIVVSVQPDCEPEQVSTPSDHV